MPNFDMPPEGWQPPEDSQEIPDEFKPENSNQNETKLQIIRNTGSQCSDDDLLPAGRRTDDGQGPGTCRQNTCLRGQNSEGHHLCRDQRREPAQRRGLQTS